jgi:excisionase family DNA binding protein
MSAQVKQDRWITTREVADRLSIHRDTVARKIKAGEFGKVLMLSMTDKRVRESSLDSFIASRLA